MRAWQHIVLLLALTSFVICTADAIDEYSLKRRRALQMADNQPEAAYEAFLHLTEHAANPYQQSDALEQAAMILANAGNYERAIALALSIPLGPRAATVHMRLLAQSKQWQPIIDYYANADFSQAPASLAEEAFYIRGKAFRESGRKAEALDDLVNASYYSHNPQLYFDLAKLALELGNDPIAAEACLYARLNMPARAGWQFYESTRTRAAILRRNGFYDLALAELDVAGEVKSGFTAVELIAERAAVLAAMGNSEEAIKLYEKALATDGIYTVQQNAINTALQKLRQQ